MNYTIILFSNTQHTELLHDRITIVILFSIVILLSATLYSQDVEAIKGSGQKNPETNSKKVCGDKLCEKPMSIKEKIDRYQSPSEESSIAQQAAKVGVVPKTKEQSKQTKPIEKKETNGNPQNQITRADPVVKSVYNGKIAFASTRDNHFEIYIMNADGTKQTRLTTIAAFNFKPSWSPDGTKIAFTSLIDDHYEIYVMNADGTGQTSLTGDTLEYDPIYVTWYNNAKDPSWSPDGTKIVFVSDDLDGNYEIYIMNADGTEQTRLTNKEGWESRPSWSPDGTKIVFRDYSGEINIMNANGKGQTTISNNAVYGFDPRWSPDGTKIVFSTSNGIYTINTDGTGLTRLTNGDNYIIYDSNPAWSPDGTKIAFVTYNDVYHNNGIYIMNADGTGQTRLTIAAIDSEFSWSPDGTKIVFVSNIDGNNEIYAMNADGTGQTRLTNDAAIDKYPSWQQLR